MEGADVLLTVAEVSVAFAGFASIVVLFQQRDPTRWAPHVVVRLRTMIETSLAALFLAVLPFALHHLGLAEEATWALGSAVLGVTTAAVAARVYAASRTLLGEGALRPAFAVATATATAVVVVLQVLNAVGAGFPRRFGPYLVGVLWTLAFAALMFLRLAVFQNGRDSGEAAP